MDPDITKISALQKGLLAWYKQNGRDFPWRSNQLTCYEKIIAELLLQRTKAETVKVFFPRFLTLYPSWSAISKKEIITLENDLKPIGLYKQRAKRISLLANEMMLRKNELPDSKEELMKLPFIGQYLACAILLLCFGEKHPLVDVNMVRLIERYFHKKQLADYRYDPFIQETAYKIVNHKKTIEINFAILDFAAKICKSEKPHCDICTIKLNCSFLKNNCILIEK